MPSIPYEFTNRSISPYGGLRAIEPILEKSGLRRMIKDLPLPGPGSNRGYKPHELVEGFLVSVILGATRFIHTSYIRQDEIIPKLFGWSRGVASQSTYSRFFKKFSLEDNDELFSELNRRWFERIGPDIHTIDLDSTVITRYGTQEGVEVGYNPKKHGRGSHHPLIAFSAEAKMVVHAWMRTGNSAASTNLVEFFNEVIKVLPKHKIGLVRADSGFYSDKVMSYFEDHDLNYIISAKMNAGLVQRIFDQHVWMQAQDGIEYCSFYYRAKGWEEARRFVVVRKDTGKLPKSSGKLLFQAFEEFERYRYSGFVTNEHLSGENIWQLYKPRADAENQIKELKENYGLEGFCAENIEATEMAFRWVTVAYNLMSLFRLIVLNNKHLAKLSTIRFQCIAIGSYLSKSARKTKLKLSASGKRRRFFEELFQKVDLMSPEKLIIQISNA